ncbi:MAG: STAS domain-containing protein [Candidatus Krumholzibacteria bacterium]|nr:STAS domain-containing protein [Candidatus Krumholzibacteria bacterium]
MEGINVSFSRPETNPDVSVLSVQGYVDTTTSAELEESLKRLLKKGRYNIVVDLAGVNYISSAGWGIFISEIKSIRENGGDLKLASMIGDVYEVFELLEFQTILQSFDSLEEAIKSFKIAAAGGGASSSGSGGEDVSSSNEGPRVPSPQGHKAE